MRYTRKVKKNVSGGRRRTRVFTSRRKGRKGRKGRKSRKGRKGRKGCIVKNKAKRFDSGYRDKWRGWYDVQKCGKCHDYCRWVGDSGPGGDPSKRTTRKVRGKGKFCGLLVS